MPIHYPGRKYLSGGAPYLCCLVQMWAAIQLLSLLPCFSPQIWVGTMSFYTVPCFCVNNHFSQRWKSRIHFTWAPLQSHRAGAAVLVLWLSSKSGNCCAFCSTYTPPIVSIRTIVFIFSFLLYQVLIQLLLSCSCGPSPRCCVSMVDRHPRVHTWTKSPLAQTDVIP